MKDALELGLTIGLTTGLMLFAILVGGAVAERISPGIMTTSDCCCECCR